MSHTLVLFLEEIDSDRRQDNQIFIYFDKAINRFIVHGTRVFEGFIPYSFQMHCMKMVIKFLKTLFNRGRNCYNMTFYRMSHFLDSIVDYKDMLKIKEKKNEIVGYDNLKFDKEKLTEWLFMLMDIESTSL